MRVGVDVFSARSPTPDAVTRAHMFRKMPPPPSVTSKSGATVDVIALGATEGSVAAAGLAVGGVVPPRPRPPFPPPAREPNDTSSRQDLLPDIQRIPAARGLPGTTPSPEIMGEPSFGPTMTPVVCSPEPVKLRIVLPE